MVDKSASTDAEKVSCAICRKEVPLTEAVIPEAVDYVAHFCGMECYAVWKKDSERKGKHSGEAGK